MKQDRFLIGILIGIGVLILSALILFYSRQSQMQYSSGDIPAAVVKNYLLALNKKDYARAYGYLKSGEGKPTADEFAKVFLSSAGELRNMDVQILETSLAGSSASVDLVLNNVNSGRTYRIYQQEESAQLVLENGAWKIETMPYPYWSYDWFSYKDK